MEACIRLGRDTPREWAFIKGKDMPGRAWRHCAKMATPIDLLLGLWTRVGTRKRKLNRICQVAPMCPLVRAHWRNLANTIEPSVCGGDVALCQMTLTTCWFTAKWPLFS